ncbi:MAG: hypothetical protein IPK82_29155 [Polyangiaceae bacterium]|nr:hypothetical protein [Polyangiaceae bacterium]
MIGFRNITPADLNVGSRVDVEPFSGSARATVPIRLSAGRQSFGPSLSLVHSQGDRGGAFGMGWSLAGIPSILIDTSRGLPTYAEGQDRYVFAGGQELVPYRRKVGSIWQTVGEAHGEYWVERFRCRVDRSFERFERWTHSQTQRVFWRAYARNGVVSVFGAAADNSTRIADPSSPNERTFQWLLRRNSTRKATPSSLSTNLKMEWE